MTRLASLLAVAGLVAALLLAFERGSTAPAVTLAGAALLLLGLASWERGPGGAREVALVATLGAVAAAGRVLFAAIPGVQPVTIVVAVTGVALGARAAIGVAGVAVLVSNAFLGHGPWTPWQMLAWGLIGVAAAALAPLLRRRVALACFGAVAAMAYGALLSTWNLAATGPTFTLSAVTATWLRGVPFDVAHAVGNVALALAAGPALNELLDRYARRLRVEIEWSDENATVEPVEAR